MVLFGSLCIHVRPIHQENSTFVLTSTQNQHILIPSPAFRLCLSFSICFFFFFQLTVEGDSETESGWDPSGRPPRTCTIITPRAANMRTTRVAATATDGGNKIDCSDTFRCNGEVPRIDSQENFLTFIYPGEIHTLLNNHTLYSKQM